MSDPATAWLYTVGSLVLLYFAWRTFGRRK